MYFLVLEKPINGLGSQAASPMKSGQRNENILNKNDHELIIRSSDQVREYFSAWSHRLVGDEIVTKDKTSNIIHQSPPQ